MVAPDALARVSLFDGLSPAELEPLAGCVRERRYARNETIFFRGDPGDSLCIIESGTVKISVTSPEGKEMILALLGSGDFFGELALLDGKPRSADAIAVEPVRIALLQRADFLRTLETQPSIAIKLLAVLSHRVRQDVESRQDAAFLDVPARLASAILRLAGEQDDERHDAASNPRLTQADLAGLVGATRESVNKWLKHFERQGYITYERGRITVLRPEELRRRIGY